MDSYVNIYETVSKEVSECGVVPDTTSPDVFAEWLLDLEDRIKDKLSKYSSEVCGSFNATYEDLQAGVLHLNWTASGKTQFAVLHVTSNETPLLGRSRTQT